MAWIRCGVPAGKTYKFSDFYNYTDIPSDIVGATVCRGLYGATTDQVWVEVYTTSDSIPFYHTIGPKIIRGYGSRHIPNDYIPTGCLCSIWSPDIIKSTIPSFTTSSGYAETYLTDLTDLENHMPLRTIDITNQNGEVVLVANCTLADLGLVQP